MHQLRGHGRICERIRSQLRTWCIVLRPTMPSPLIGKKLSKTPAQVLIKHIIQRDIVAIPKSSNPARTRENFQVSQMRYFHPNLSMIYDPRERLKSLSHRQIFSIELHPRNANVGVKGDPRENPPTNGIVPAIPPGIKLGRLAERREAHCLASTRRERNKTGTADTMAAPATSVPFYNGQKMPLVGLGTFLMKKLECSRRVSDGIIRVFVDLCQAPSNEVGAAVDAALEAGYRHIDTAYIYRNEEAIGQALKKWLDSGRIKREELFIVTKLPPFGNRPECVEKYLKKSLEALKLSYVDLYLVHTPLGFLEHDGVPMNKLVIDHSTDHLGIWKVMEAQVDAGRTRAIGLSNFNARQIKRIVKAARIPPANLQVELSVYFQQRELAAFCNALDITVCSYAPLGSPGLAAHDNLLIASHNYEPGSIPGGEHAGRCYSPTGFLGVLPFPPALAFRYYSTSPHFKLSGVQDLSRAATGVLTSCCVRRPPTAGPLTDSAVLEVAKKHSKTPAQVLIRHVVQRGIVVIPKSTNPGRIRENFQVFDFQLDKSDMEKLDSLDKGTKGRVFGRNHKERSIWLKLDIETSNVLTQYIIRALAVMQFNGSG
ncbi:hypothetical protein PR048_027185 [Dryococelus australis]|uniref:NADP-dependent oxidoreductase domain-containing protein n=1 Tax=Dryococelus australis TaxID=614101 RepID=A0ABQ9GGJ5_9NEOP|nr:hypothetical protein PR048_027185 [Dryococelus australis]